MKKFAIFLITTVFFTQYCLAAELNNLNNQNNLNNKETSIPAAAEPVVIDENMSIDAVTKHEEDAQLPYEIDYTYPQITGDTLSASAKKFNQIVLDQVNKSVQQFKNYVKADILHMQTLPDSLKHNSFNMDYSVKVVPIEKQAKEVLISVRMSIEGMQAGRAHPYHQHQVVNYDLNKGKILTLKDLFKPRVNYLAALAKIAINDLTKKIQDKWMIKDGAAPLAKNYLLWNLQNKSILITFEEYQVAPYVYGPQEVEISFTAIKNLLAPHAPIAD